MKLMTTWAAAAALVTLAGASAFADSRPPRGTRDSGGVIRRDGGAAQESARRNEGGSIRRDGTSSRGRGPAVEHDRDRGGQQYGREDDFRGRRSWSSRQPYDASRHRTTQPYHTSGRISRMHRYGGGYRVWVAGAPYPFYIPDHYYHRDRFRVGLWIDIGGWYNPGGYYDYYDRYDDRAGRWDRYDRRSYSRDELRGYVENVARDRSSFVLWDERAERYVTVYPRGRRVYVRPGEYVEVDGTWTRSGFMAYDIDWLDRDRYEDRDEE